MIRPWLDRQFARLLPSELNVGGDDDTRWRASSAGFRRPSSRAAVWSVIALLTVATYFALDVSGNTLISVVPSAWLGTMRLVVNLGLVGLIALLASMYETTIDRLLGEVRAVNLALARAKDEVEQAHRDSRLVLDHVAEGLLVVDRGGVVAKERSRALAAMLPSSEGAVHLWDVFASESPTFAQELELGWAAVYDHLLPFEVTRAQLPQTCTFGGRVLSIEYVPIGAGAGAGPPDQMLVVVQDVTAEAQARAVEQTQREQLDVFKWIVQDREFFRTFYREAKRLVESLGDFEDGPTSLESRRGGARSIEMRNRLRALHTLEGNASLFGLRAFAEACHAAEGELRNGALTSIDPELLRSVRDAWSQVKATVDPMLGSVDDGSFVVSRKDYLELLDLVGTRDRSLQAHVKAWSWKPVATSLGRLAEQAKSLSMRLHQRDVHVTVQAQGTKVPTEEWASFWAACVHFVRNAIDHGIEPADDRIARGKRSIGTIAMRAREEGGALVFEFVDDGRGIDWEKVRERARACGLPCRTAEDLERALFADGLSTRDHVGETSGRGVGLSAVLASCQSIGGRVHVRSERGQGTRIHVRIPLHRPLALAA